MFTFGRNRELEYVRECHGSRATAPLLLRLVDSVHDFLEGTASRQDLERSIERALVEGEGGIWETAGSWLLKLNADAPESRDLWRKLAAHPSATVRFRIASFLDEVAEELGRELYGHLSADRSKRVREHAFGTWDFRMHPELYGSPARGGGA